MSTSRCEARALDDLEKLLLLAGLFWHRKEQGDAEGFVPSVMLTNLVLHWRGLTTEEIEAGWAGEGDKIPASHQQVFEALVNRVHQLTQSGELRPPMKNSQPLFIGKGNWGVPGDPDQPPASPEFTLCQTTPHGLEIAEKLLAENPDFGPLLETVIEERPREEGFTPNMDESICQMLNLSLFGGEIATGSLLEKLNNFKQRALAEGGGDPPFSNLPVKLQSEISEMRWNDHHLPCVYNATWMDGDSPGSVFTDFFRKFQHLHSHHFRLWEFHQELFFVDLSSLKGDPLVSGSQLDYPRKEERWLATRVAEALEVARTIPEKSVLILKRFFHGPARTAEMVAESFRDIPR